MIPKVHLKIIFDLSLGYSSGGVSSIFGAMSGMLRFENMAGLV